MSAVNPTILKTCVEGVLASAIKDYRDAVKDAQFSMEPAEATEQAWLDLKKVAGYRRQAIVDAYRDAVTAPPVPTCCRCSGPATTRVASSDFCAEHARTAPRLARPGA